MNANTEAATALVAQTDDYSLDNVRVMAKAVMAETGATYQAAKNSVTRAIARKRGETAPWGGARPNLTGRRSKQAQEQDEQAAAKLLKESNDVSV